MAPARRTWVLDDLNLYQNGIPHAAYYLRFTRRVRAPFRLQGGGGYKLRSDRSHMLTRNRAFIVPVCLDATPDAGADADGRDLLQGVRICPQRDSPNRHRLLPR
jgi:hypothetical protein